jgi:hypothetical protein
MAEEDSKYFSEFKKYMRRGIDAAQQKNLTDARRANVYAPDVSGELDRLMRGVLPVAIHTSSSGADEPLTLKERIKKQIDNNVRSIATLEWFARHLGLEPPEGLDVDDIICAGLETFAQRKR